MKQIFNTRQVSKKVFFHFSNRCLSHRFELFPFSIKVYQAVRHCAHKKHSILGASCRALTPRSRAMSSLCTATIARRRRTTRRRNANSRAPPRNRCTTTVASLVCALELSLRRVKLCEAQTAVRVTTKKKRTRRTKAHTKRQHRFVCSNTDASACCRVQHTP